MKFALCLRGINYIKDYMHDYKRGMTPYTIDFADNIPYLFKNIIEPLREANHTIDIFFVTYESPKLQEFIDLLKPKKLQLNTFNSSITSYHWKNVFQLMIDSLKLVEEYEKSQEDKYDYTIVSRFDTIYIENILKVYLEPNGISVPAVRDDCVFVVGKNLNARLIELLEYMKDFTNLTTHDYTKFLTDKGIPCHAMYGRYDFKGYYPFTRISRQHFVNPKHIYYTSDVKDIYNPDSEYYGFKYKPLSEFCSCYE